MEIIEHLFVFVKRMFGGYERNVWKWFENVWYVWVLEDLGLVGICGVEYKLRMFGYLDVWMFGYDDFERLYAILLSPIYQLLFREYPQISDLSNNLL